MPKVVAWAVSYHLDQLRQIGEVFKRRFPVQNCCKTFRQPKNTLSFCQEPNVLLEPVTANISPGCGGHLGEKAKFYQNLDYKGEEGRKRLDYLTRSSTSRPLAFLRSEEAILAMLDDLKLLPGSLMIEAIGERDI